MIKLNKMAFVACALVQSMTSASEPVTSLFAKEVECLSLLGTCSRSIFERVAKTNKICLSEAALLKNLELNFEGAAKDSVYRIFETDLGALVEASKGQALLPEGVRPALLIAQNPYLKKFETNRTAWREAYVSAESSLSTILAQGLQGNQSVSDPDTRPLAPNTFKLFKRTPEVYETFKSQSQQIEKLWQTFKNLPDLPSVLALSKNPEDLLMISLRTSARQLIGLGLAELMQHHLEGYFTYIAMMAFISQAVDPDASIPMPQDAFFGMTSKRKP